MFLATVINTTDGKYIGTQIHIDEITLKEINISLEQLPDFRDFNHLSENKLTLYNSNYVLTLYIEKDI